MRSWGGNHAGDSSPSSTLSAVVSQYGVWAAVVIRKGLSLLRLPHSPRHVHKFVEWAVPWDRVMAGRFRAGPFPLNSGLRELPVARDLAGLFERIIRSHIPLPARKGESLAAHFARFAVLETKRRHRQQLEARIAREKHFNRKVERNAKLRHIKLEMRIL